MPRLPLGLILSGCLYHLSLVNQDSPLGPSLRVSLAQNSVQDSGKPGKRISSGRATSTSSLEISLLLCGSRRSVQYHSLNTSAIVFCLSQHFNLLTYLKDNLILFFCLSRKILHRFSFAHLTMLFLPAITVTWLTIHLLCGENTSRISVGLMIV